MAVYSLICSLTLLALARLSTAHPEYPAALLNLNTCPCPADLATQGVSVVTETVSVAAKTSTETVYVSVTPQPLPTPETVYISVTAPWLISTVYISSGTTLDPVTVTISDAPAQPITVTEVVYEVSSLDAVTITPLPARETITLDVTHHMSDVAGVHVVTITKPQPVETITRDIIHTVSDEADTQAVTPTLSRDLSPVAVLLTLASNHAKPTNVHDPEDPVITKAPAIQDDDDGHDDDEEGEEDEGEDDGDDEEEDEEEEIEDNHGDDIPTQFSAALGVTKHHCHHWNGTHCKGRTHTTNLMCEVSTELVTVYNTVTQTVYPNLSAPSSPSANGTASLSPPYTASSTKHMATTVVKARVPKGPGMSFGRSKRW